MIICAFSHSRVRLPRAFGAANHKVLVPYSHKKAFRQFAVSSTCGARYSNEHCCYHVVYNDRLYLLTDQRILCLAVDTLELIWKLSFKSKATHSLATTGFVDVAVTESFVLYTNIIHAYKHTHILAHTYTIYLAIDRCHRYFFFLCRTWRC